jgi:hypothetical protein
MGMLVLLLGIKGENTLSKFSKNLRTPTIILDVPIRRPTNGTIKVVSKQFSIGFQFPS